MSLTTGNNSIDALVGGSWSALARTAVTITYSFMQDVPSGATAEDADGFAPMTETQIDAVRFALALWADVANVRFVELPATASGDIQFGTNDQSKEKSAGYAYLPDPADLTSLFLFLNNKDASNSELYLGGYGFLVLIHEIGHTLGLKHPGNYDGTSGSGIAPFLPADTDNTNYSLMSYNSPPSAGPDEIFPFAPMLYDIQAVQYLYGANPSTRTGNDRYFFENDDLIYCFWDAGGTNTFDFGQCTGGSVIDLNPGAFSSTNGKLDNISIAYGVAIQVAVGSADADRIIANDLGNTITAGAGTDIIMVGGGSDWIDGGNGDDTVVFSGNASTYALVSSGATWTVTGQGSDVLTGVETVRFADRTLALGDLLHSAQVVPDQSVPIGSAVNFSIPSATFVGGASTGPIALNATLASGQALPSWLTFDAASGTFSGIPATSEPGALQVSVSAAGTPASGSADSLHVSAREDFFIFITKPGAALVGGAGNDALKLDDGNDSVNGGAGLDTVSAVGARANYLVRSTATGFNLADTVGKGGVDTLTDVERIIFSDGAIALDIDGVAGQTYRLYQAAFDRLPDQTGLGFWIDALDHGQTLLTVANAFLSAPEFTNLYGSTLSSAEYVYQLYLNVLHRAPDVGGFNFHVDHLDGTNVSGLNPNHIVISRSETLVFFSDSPEYSSSVATLVATGVSYTPWLG